MFKSMGYSPGFCSKSPNFGPQRIHPKSIQIVPQALRKPFERIQKSFQKVWSDFQHLPKSAMFKTMGYSPGFFSKSANFGPQRIHPKSIQIVPQAHRNPFASIQESFQKVWEDFQHLPKSAMFKSMGYSQGFLLKIGQLRTQANSPEIHSNSPASNQKYIYKHIGVFSGSLERFPTLAKVRHVQKHGLQPRLLPKIGQARTQANSPEIHSNSPASTQKSICKHIGVLSESLGRFPTLAKIRRVQKHGLQPRLFAQNRPKVGPWRIHPKSIQIVPQPLRNTFTSTQESFQEVWSDFQHLRKSAMFKSMGYSPGYCPKSAKLGPYRIHPKSIQIVPQALRIPDASIQESFQKVWSDSQHLPKSAMFKSMGYSPGFLLKIGQVRTLAHSPEIHSNSPASTQKSIGKHIGVLSEGLERFPTLAKIRHVTKHLLQPRLFAQNRPISNPSEFTRNPFKQSRKHIEIHLQAYRSPFRKFGKISNTCENPPCSKAWAIAQAFCSKSANFGTWRIHPKSIQIVPQVIRNTFKSTQESFQEVWSDFQHLPKSAMFKSMGYSPCFCPKSAKLGPQRIHPKSIQIVPQALRNPDASIQESFEKVWSDFQHLPKSAMFKSMGYSPGFLLKIGQVRTLAHSPEIHSNSPASTQKSIYKHIGVLSEGLKRLPTLAKIRHVQKHLLQPRLFAQNRPISNPSEFTRNPFKQSRKHIESHLQVYRSPFRKFGKISNTCQNPPCSKPWAIAQAFCSKSANFGTWRIHPKSIQIVPQAIRNTFTSTQESFQDVWSDFQHLRKSAMFKSMGYSPGFCPKSAKLGHQRIHPKSIEIVPEGLRNPDASIQESFQKIWSDFQQLPKSAMFKSMGYSPGFLLKIGQVRTLAHSPEIHSNSPASTQKSICKHIGVFSESLERFPTLAKIRHVQKHGLQPRLFAQNRPSPDPGKFTRNPFKQSRKHLEIHLQAHRSPFRKFGAISNTCQNPPCSKARAIAQALCSKSANFGLQRIHPKSIQIVPQALRNPFPSIQESFQKVWSDFQHLPKSAMFKSMGYSPGFLLKIGQFRTLANSPEIHSNSPAITQKSICKHIGVLSESLERFPTLAKIRHVQKHGLQPRLFAQNRPISDPSEFTRNPFKQSRNHLEIHRQAHRSPFRRFGAISNTCQNPPCYKA